MTAFVAGNAAVDQLNALLRSVGTVFQPSTLTSVPSTLTATSGPGSLACAVANGQVTNHLPCNFKGIHTLHPPGVVISHRLSRYIAHTSKAMYSKAILQQRCQKALLLLHSSQSLSYSPMAQCVQDCDTGHGLCGSGRLPERRGETRGLRPARFPSSRHPTGGHRICRRFNPAAAALYNPQLTWKQQRNFHFIRRYSLLPAICLLTWMSHSPLPSVKSQTIQCQHHHSPPLIKDPRAQGVSNSVPDSVTGLSDVRK